MLCDTRFDLIILYSLFFYLLFLSYIQMPFDFSPDSKKAIRTLADVVAKQAIAEDAKADLFGAKNEGVHWGEFQRKLCFRLFDAGKVTYPMIKGQGEYKGRNDNNVMRKLRTLGCFGEYWSDPRDHDAQNKFVKNMKTAYEKLWKPTPFSPGWYLAQGQEPPKAKTAGSSAQGSLASPPSVQGNIASFTSPAPKGRDDPESVEDGNDSPLSPVSSNGGEIYRETTADIEADLEKAMAEHENTEEECAVELKYLKEHDAVVTQLARSELILNQNFMDGVATLKMNAEALVNMASNLETLAKSNNTGRILEEAKSLCYAKIATEKKRLQSARKVKDKKQQLEKSKEADM